MHVKSSVFPAQTVQSRFLQGLCHYGSLVMEFRDAWAEGDGDRILRCWRLFLPHFRASGRTKYSLEAFRLQLQVNVVLSPNLAHQVKWHRFVNTKGGFGNNIPLRKHLYRELFAASTPFTVFPSSLTRKAEFQSLPVRTPQNPM